MRSVAAQLNRRQAPPILDLACNFMLPVQGLLERMSCLGNIIGKFVASGRHRSTQGICMQEQHLTMW